MQFKLQQCIQLVYSVLLKPHMVWYGMVWYDICIRSIYVLLDRWLFIKLVIPHQQNSVHPSSTENKYACESKCAKTKKQTTK